MKKIITILVMACSLLVATSPTNAQATLSFSLTADSVGYGVPNFSIEVFGNLHNLTGSTLKFKAVRLTNDLPSGWAYNQFCLGSYCYSPVISSAIDSMPGDSSKKFYANWQPDGSYATGHILMEFFNMKDSSYRIYQNFYGVTNSTGTSAGITEVYSTAGPIGVFPDPFTTTATISVPAFLMNDNASLHFTLFDETGRAVRSFPITESGDVALERGTLGSGIYFYSVLNSNNTALIQRGKLIIY